MPPRPPTFTLGAFASSLFPSAPNAASIAVRTFASTPILPAKSSRTKLAHMMRSYPPYPYPIKFTFKQAWFGLYGGRHIIFGNKIAEDSEQKSRRTWLPNVKCKRLWSQALGEFIKVDVVVAVLRTIDKVGGLDNYLTGEKPARVKELGPTGWKLRWRVLNTKGYEEQLAREKERYGIVEMKDIIAKKKLDAAGLGEVVPEDQVLSSQAEARA